MDLVGFAQRLEIGANDLWPFGRPAVGSIYWIAAILLVVMLLVTAWPYVRLLGYTQLGWLLRLQIAAVIVGAFGLLVLGCYLLLIGWPGTQLDTLWGVSAASRAGGREPCMSEVRQLVALQTQLRTALNNRASWGLLGALALFILGHLLSLVRRASRPTS
jgi:type VI protein secretion system component VasK